MPWIAYNVARKLSKNGVAKPFCTVKTEKRILFLKNEPGKLLKTQENSQKRTGNEPETKLPNLLKIKDWPKKRTGNEPETNLAMLLKTKGGQKTNRKQTGKLSWKPPARIIHPSCAVLPPAGHDLPVACLDNSPALPCGSLASDDKSAACPTMMPQTKALALTSAPAHPYAKRAFREPLQAAPQGVILPSPFRLRVQPRLRQWPFVV